MAEYFWLIPLLPGASALALLLFGRRLSRTWVAWQASAAGFAAVVGFLIHVYSAGYMAEDRNPSRYFAFLNLFTFFMLVLVMASDIVLMFVGWEGVGLCSYLLIGFWFERPAAGKAGMKAFIR